MKKIRKYIILALTAAVALVAAACGSGSASQGSAAQEGSDVITIAVEQNDSAAGEAAGVSENKTEDSGKGDDSAADDVKTPSGYSFGKFTTVDLDGNEVTEAVFSQKEYTMVNLWGTFCPPCIAEMPQLQELNESLPENVQIIGLISNLQYGAESERTKNDADAIVTETGVKYQNLLIWDDALRMLPELSSFIPTTFFVDSEGNILGEPIIGAYVDRFKDRIIALCK